MTTSGRGGATVVGRGHGSSPRTALWVTLRCTYLWAAARSLRFCRTYCSVGVGADHAHPGPHHRVGAPREEGRLPSVDALAIGSEPGLGGLAGDRVHLAAEGGDEPPVHDVGGGDVEDDRGVHGHHELAVGEDPVAGPAARILEPPQPLLPDRVDRRAAWRRTAPLSPPTWATRLLDASRPSGPVGFTSRALPAITIPTTNMPAATTASGTVGRVKAPGPADEAPRCAPAASPEAEDRGDQEDVDRDHQQRGDRDRDPVRRADVVGVRRVPRPRAEDRRLRRRREHRQRQRGQSRPGEPRCSVRLRRTTGRPAPWQTRRRRVSSRGAKARAS